MQNPASRSRTVFRACVVNAVREGETLITDLIKVTRGALASQESGQRDIARRNLASDALRLLNQHEPAMAKSFPMALLEIFADGPGAAKPRQSGSSPLDFGELSLIDDDEVQAQVELSRAHQLALHATDAVLAELNGLVSAAQGFNRVQPERNPLRPENYIRALQQVVGETGVAAPVRDLWMQNMRDLLGQQLVEVYKRAIQNLREQGIQPVGYGVSAMAGLGRGGQTGYGGGYNSGWTGAGGSGYGGSVYGAPATGYGNPSMYGRAGMASGWSDPGPSMLAAEAEEALLTVGILRQMLAGGGDPYDALRAPPSVMAVPPGAVAPAAGNYPSAAVSEAMEDMAQLERLVGRLAQGQPGYAPSVQPGYVPSVQPGYVPSGQGSTRSLYGVSFGNAVESPALAAEVVARMMENISQDQRLLPSMQRAMLNLEPAIRKLVRHDNRFFSDTQHPARRMLDELTQRSLAFTSEESSRFKRFMRLVDQAVNHLAQQEIVDGTPFEAVLKALESTWETQERKIQERREADEKAQRDVERRELLTEKIAANIRALPGVAHVPADVMDFAAGPWAAVVALAQMGGAETDADGDPGGYLALVPLLFWSVQPGQVGNALDELVDAIPGLLAKLREGLTTIEHPEAEVNAFVERLVYLHQQVLEAPFGEPEAEEEPLDSLAATEDEPPQTVVDVELDTGLAEIAAPAVEDGFVIGTWVDLVSNGKVMRTQLTWTSPHKTLFLFTAIDNSTQSMTRRMRDKLAAEGALRIVSDQERAADAARSKRAAPAKKTHR